ncbi:efflux RND transporter permease subunit [Tropicimonas sp. TH_r6]|uniref:efflux RND transporter permease subunit n=1 Tax=Tropicimonas sp. TH_r6 TaxID=3082085 RepID=UPI002952A511|nr:efflux RND transporter permease subunit [Tropicimonas sp. TH_r6]MDV7142717.1 efflux RND transporter permease subunit [Tropicimonas sp. TH_r6]
MRIVSFFARHATAANLLMLLVVGFGLYAATQIRAQFMPDVVTEEINVRIDWDDASAEDVSRDIVEVVSPSLLGVEGVTSLSGKARDGDARITLEFEPGWDLDLAVEEVEAALPSSRSLPDDADDPVIERGHWRDRVFDLVLSGAPGTSVSRMEALGADLEHALLKSGLTKAELRGQTTPEITVEITAARLAEHGTTLTDLAKAIEQGTRDQAAGEAGDNATPVRVGQDRLSVEGLAELPRRTDRGVVPLGEIARFTEAEPGSERAYFLEGRPAVSISVERGTGGDALDIHATALQVADAFLAQHPDDLQVDLVRNNAAEIEERLALLIDNAAFGLLLVLLLLFLFLSPSAALWVAAGIPVAMCASLGLMWLTGQSINMISLFALLICLGIIVDDAIVIAENAEARRRRFNERPAQAAERAARRMLAPVLASSVTTVVAFLSLRAIEGDFGAFIATIPLVVATVLIASLGECFLVLPHHLAHAGGRLDRSPLAWPSRWLNRGFDRLRKTAFVPLIRAVISARYAVLLLAVGALAQAVLLVAERDVKWRFFDAPQQPTISANIAMRDDASRADTEAMLAEVLRATNAVRARFEAEYGADPVKIVLTEIGGTAGRGLQIAEDKDADQLGALTIELIAADLRPYETDAFVLALEQELRRPETLEVFSFRARRSGPGGQGLDVALFGPGPEVVDQAAEALKDALTGYPEITGLEDDLTLSSTGQALRLTGFGAALGFDEADLAEEVQARLGGVEATTFQIGKQTATIEVSLPEEALSAAYLEEVLLQSATGRWAELGEIVDVAADPTVKAIHSYLGEATVRVSGEISTEDALASEEILQAIESVELPAIAREFGVTWSLEGLAAQEKDFLSEAVIGYGICLLLIYMTLALVLGHWVWPLAIMCVIPVGLTGVIWGHYWWEMNLSIFSIVGLIGLSGIIVNDSIVLVSAISERMKQLPEREAVVQATSERLRPVLLTTLTTVLGLAPLLFEASTQAEFLKPTAVTLCFGLAFGLFIVLLMVPSLIVVQADFRNLLSRVWRAQAERPAPNAPT